jgi:hypothetical protein
MFPGRKVELMASEIRNGVPAATIVGAAWRKSKHSGAIGNCVEVAPLNGGDIAMRNSRNPSGPALVYPGVPMAGFVAAVKGGQFDDLRG